MKQFPVECLMPEAGLRENFNFCGMSITVSVGMYSFQAYITQYKGRKRGKKKNMKFGRRFEIFTTASGREHRAVVVFSWKNSQTTNQDIHLSDETTIMQREKEKEKKACVCE